MPVYAFWTHLSHGCTGHIWHVGAINPMDLVRCLHCIINCYSYQRSLDQLANLKLKRIEDHLCSGSNMRRSSRGRRAVLLLCIAPCPFLLNYVSAISLMMWCVSIQSEFSEIYAFFALINAKIRQSAFSQSRLVKKTSELDPFRAWCRMYIKLEPIRYT